MSAIAKDASITLITAVPGSGKTLRVVWYIREALREGNQVFVCNVNGLISEGEWAGWIPFEDPTKWEELPTGSVLVVDEAQQFFRAALGNVPSYIAAMETIRHMGIRLILITQSPALIHTNIRALVGRHEHLVRENGKEASVLYRRNSVIDNVRSDKALAKEDYTTWPFPKDCYGAYKSAEIHTVKRTVPHKHRRAMIFGAIAVCIFGWVFFRVTGKFDTPEEAGLIPAAQAAGAAAPASEGRNNAPRTAREYAEQFTPLIAEMPWTMPGAMDRPVQVQPTLVCMSSGYDGQDGCSCMTEQGTLYTIELDRCVHIARYGPAYNPYKAASYQTLNGQPVQDGSIYGAPAASRSGSGSVIPGAQVHAYGDIGREPNPDT